MKNHSEAFTGSVQMVPSPIVEADNVSKSYGNVHVLKDVSISIPPGDSRALVGRNGAGKSTLVSILTGMTDATSGEIRFGGVVAPPRGDRAAWREKVSCVYQRWTIIPTLTVAENLFLNNQPANGSGFLSWRTMRERAADVLRDWSLELSPDLEAWRLTVEQRQIVEIARALLQGSRFIILDEPTAELERREVNRLFDRIKRLQSDGVTFCYISHHLEEIYEICSTTTVLRDGRVVADERLENLPKSELVAAMVGSAQETARRRATAACRPDTVLSVRGLSIPSLVNDVSFQIAAGECLGLAGLATSGKEEIGAAIAGLVKNATGVVTIDGKALRFGDVVAVRKTGVGYVPRDRHEQGLLPQLSLAENITVTIADSLASAGFISTKRQDRSARSLMSKLGIVASSPMQPIAELSGGNQQKGIMARALASDPRLLVLISPTQGVDIASKDALFAIVSEAQKAGAAVLLVSDDLDELAVCNRIHVVFRGELTKQFGSDWRDQDMVAAIEGLEENHDHK